MKKVALIVGHNLRSKGAYSSIIGSEFDYWRRIAKEIKNIIPGVVDVYERSPDIYYTREMFKVLEKLNQFQYNFCLELHFNSSTNPQACGCECYLYHTNDKAKMLATNFMVRLQNVFGTQIRNNHGINLVANSHTRGGYGICKSKWTYILIEPFFGSNPGEAKKFSDENKIVELLVKFIIENT
ncbi:N-acetylmuramoyl-L-alanine amidase [Fusobacterium vincentii]|uniref:N-acetylmuramoyl-L-alanine amidase n=1 Tax=Fusobacterium vincentii TaxID=155615 RepID=UPI001C6DFC0C|nr:N-acetylmuramoyl-L-alanine amidase [Fusobacterium vincentii]QYR57798.1 N-acetylmuramoyl-L-alanine amidase [Fusobacterium vincentii]